MDVGTALEDLHLTSKDFYWDGYSHFRTHEQLLKDNSRVNAFRKAILRNAHLFKGKTVLDVGCGTGILSMFAAQAGAKHVYAVDSADIIRFTRRIVAANKFGDVITVIKGKIQEVTLPVEKVDIILCSWQGYFLFQESLIDLVLFARDKWLAPDGLIFPDKAYIYICGVEDASYKRQKIDWWNNVENYDMSCMKEMVIREPCIDSMNTSAIVTDTYFVTSVDLKTMKREDINIDAPFVLRARRRDICSAFLTYYDLEFSQCHRSVFFSTAPGSEWTGYKQTLFYIQRDLELGKGEVIKGNLKISMKKDNNREVDISITFSTGQQRTPVEQAYRLVSN